MQNTYFEWVKDLEWYAPLNIDIVRVDEYIDISKGRLVVVKIEQKPENLDKFREWMGYRKEINKPIDVKRVYLCRVKKHAIMVKMHADSYPVFITIPDMDVYVQREALVKSYKLRSNLRYVLAYSGYKLKYKYTKTRIDRKRMYKHEQATLCIF